MRAAPSVVRNLPRSSPIDLTGTGGVDSGPINDTLDCFAQVVATQQFANRISDGLTRCYARLSFLEEQARKLRWRMFNATEEQRAFLEESLAPIMRELEKAQTERRDLERKRNNSTDRPER